MHESVLGRFCFWSKSVSGTAPTIRGALYPIGLKVEGRRCLVVGAGPTAHRKARDLAGCGAIVRAIDRDFDPSDLDGVCVVVAATDDPRLQESVSKAAEARGIPCNVVDVNRFCSFYTPAILRRGDVTVSVATNGKFPLLAVAIRDVIACVLPDAVGPSLEALEWGRSIVFARYPDDPEARTAALKRLLTPQALEWILHARLGDLDAHWASWKESLP